MKDPVKDEPLKYREKKMLKGYFDEEYGYVKEKRALELADIRSAISKRNKSGGSGNDSKTTKEDYRNMFYDAVDRNTGFADYNKLKQIDQEYFRDTGSHFSQSDFKSILSPSDLEKYYK